MDEEAILNAKKAHRNIGLCLKDTVEAFKDSEITEGEFSASCTAYTNARFYIRTAFNLPDELILEEDK